MLANFIQYNGAGTAKLMIEAADDPAACADPEGFARSERPRPEALHPAPQKR